jgi:hypothetical protein
MPRFSGLRLLRPAAALVLAALAALTLAGCGTAAAPKPGPAVSLKLTTPVSGRRTASQSTTVRGVVTPHRAAVLVLGRRVRVAPNGSFSASVALTPGTNLIDLEASLPRSAGAVAAVSVVRFLLISVPSVVGDTPAQAGAALRALGLAVKTNGSSDPFNFLIPGTTQVCSSAPSSGTKVDPGSTVTIKTSKFCF